MSVFFCITMFVLGLFFLVGGSSLFVDSAVSIAKKFRVSEVLVGATVVSLGTTLPEILFSTGASFRGYTDMALGNALGSILCNTGFISGVMLCIVSVQLNSDARKNIKRHMGFLAASVCVYVLSGIFFSGLTRDAGILLVGIGIWFLRLAADNTVSQQNGTAGKKEEKLVVSDVLRLFLEIPFAVTLLLILCLPAVKAGRTKKWQGGLLVCIYGLYLWCMLNGMKM